MVLCRVGGRSRSHAKKGSGRVVRCPAGGGGERVVLVKCVAECE